MKLYKLTHFENEKETFSNIYVSLEVVEDYKSTRSHIKSYCNGKEILTTYKVEEFESETEPTFDVYVNCNKCYYSERAGKRISDLSLEKATEIYNRYATHNYVELQLPQKQFGSIGITKVISNYDENYYSMKQAYWDKRAEEEEKYYSPSTPWLAPGMSISDFI